MFICIDGEVVDGHQFASRAVELGAVAIIAEKQVDVSIPVIYVRDSKRAMAMLADYFYGSPTEALKLVGITVRMVDDREPLSGTNRSRKW